MSFGALLKLAGTRDTSRQGHILSFHSNAIAGSSHSSHPRLPHIPQPGRSITQNLVTTHQALDSSVVHKRVVDTHESMVRLEWTI